MKKCRTGTLIVFDKDTTICHLIRMPKKTNPTINELIKTGETLFKASLEIGATAKERQMYLRDAADYLHTAARDMEAWARLIAHTENENDHQQ